MNTRKDRKKTISSQVDDFKRVARELGCDEDEANFDAKLKEVARSKPPPKDDDLKR